MNKVIYSTTTQTGDDDDGIVTIPPSARRAAELAALEREIGRAVIGEAILDNIDAPFTDLRDCYHAIYTARYGAIARYRALLAWRADAATGSEDAG